VFEKRCEDWIAEWLDGETNEGMVTNALKVLKNE
jgi:hypothetical protein